MSTLHPTYSYENLSRSILFIEQAEPMKATSFFIPPAKSLLIRSGNLIWTPIAILMHNNQAIGPGWKYPHPHRPLVKLYTRVTLRKQHRAAEIGPRI